MPSCIDGRGLLRRDALPGSQGSECTRAWRARAPSGRTSARALLGGTVLPLRAAGPCARVRFGSAPSGCLSPCHRPPPVGDAHVWAPRCRHSPRLSGCGPDRGGAVPRHVMARACLFVCQPVPCSGLAPVRWSAASRCRRLGCFAPRSAQDLTLSRPALLNGAPGSAGWLPFLARLNRLCH